MAHNMWPLGSLATWAQRRMHRTKPIWGYPAPLPSSGQFFSGYRTHDWSRPFSLVSTLVST